MVDLLDSPASESTAVDITKGNRRRIKLAQGRKGKKAKEALEEKKRRVIKAMWKHLKSPDVLSEAELKTEAYNLYKRKLLTKEQARTMGCAIR